MEVLQVLFKATEVNIFSSTVVGKSFYIYLWNVYLPNKKIHTPNFKSTYADNKKLMKKLTL